jgi:hypothetical protein
MVLTATPYAYSAVTNAPAGAGAAKGSHVAPFTIKGTIARRELWPGRYAPINVGFVNNNGVPLRINHLRVTKVSLDAPNATGALPCTFADFRVKQPGKAMHVLVQPHETLSLKRFGVPGSQWPGVGLYDTDYNQDGCKGATLTLGYTARGRVPR